MTDTAEETPAVHSTFRLERRYPVPPARVWAAFAEPEARRRWFVEGAGFDINEYSPDFRIGGRDRYRFSFRGGPEITNDTFYLDLLPERRLVFAYAMTKGGIPISASLTTVELVPDGDGTLLVHTEQGTYLNRSDDGTDRERGTAGLLARLGQHLAA